MKLSYFPQVKVYHTSKTFHGQIYIPLANWVMMIGSVIVTAVYNNVRIPLTAFEIYFTDFTKDHCPR
jgi:K+ transporter